MFSSPLRPCIRYSTGVSADIAAGENAEPLSLYLREIGLGKVPVGPPVFVFLRLAGSYITDSAQILNIQAAAELSVQENLLVRITGAADSATDSPEKNAELALARAEQVAKLMREGCPGGEDRGLVRGRDCLLRTPLRESELPDRAVRLLRPMIPER